MKKRVAIFGSTGSIGHQALEVVDENKDKFEVEILTARKNAELLIKQAIRYKPNVVVIVDEVYYNEVSKGLDKFDIKVYAGENALNQVMEMETIDMVIMAIVGFAALKPTIAAIKNHRNIALANKESLVVAGEILAKSASYSKSLIIPVDSELSAIFQCLTGEQTNPIDKIILTASGGPFRDNTLETIEKASVEEALNHPTWQMGNKVTIDSATLMNKGLEAIEAKWLFNLKPEQIEVMIHPQSIVHSLVYFQDGSVKAQLSLPDMRIPIRYAMSYPNRLPAAHKQLDLKDVKSLTFENPNVEKFRNLALAFEALKMGGNMPCILNAANEIGVQAFLQQKINLTQISSLIEQCMEFVGFESEPNLEILFETDSLTRFRAQEIIKKADF